MITSYYRNLNQPQKAIDFRMENKGIYRYGLSVPLLTSLAAAYCDVKDNKNAKYCADFDCYRKKQLVSADSLDYPDGLTDVVIVHNPLYAPDEETRANFADFLRDKNVKICLSGHTHKFTLDYDVYRNGIPSLVCGGISERNVKKKGDLVYSVLRFSENAVSVKAFSAADGELRSENVSLK